jgi:hypothetical protein
MRCIRVTHSMVGHEIDAAVHTRHDDKLELVKGAVGAVRETPKKERYGTSKARGGHAGSRPWREQTAREQANRERRER